MDTRIFLSKLKVLGQNPTLEVFRFKPKKRIENFFGNTVNAQAYISSDFIIISCIQDYHL